MSESAYDESKCIDCGGSGARTVLDGAGPLCDSCADARLSAVTGYPRVPKAPSPETIVGPDRRRHRIAYRIWRSPGGICVEGMEDRDRGSGYYAEVVGGHYDDVAELVARVKARIRERIGHLDLERSSLDGHWTMAGWDVRGRLEWNDRDEPYDVIVDGRRLTWEEFGWALDSYQGWEFRLRIDREGIPDEEETDKGGATADAESAAVVETDAVDGVDEDPGRDAAEAIPRMFYADSSHWPPPAPGSPQGKARIH